MSTNYYLIYNECKCCNRSDSVHLGKSSGGWKFTFKTIEDFPLDKVDLALQIAEHKQSIDIKSWKSLKEFLQKYVVDFKTARIEDEYSANISFEEFLDLVHSKQANDNNKSHYWEIKNDSRWTFEPENELIDEEGYSFSRRDFS